MRTRHADRVANMPTTSAASDAAPKRATTWLLPSADLTSLNSVGIKVAGGGPHQSKTMMLTDLSAGIYFLRLQNEGQRWVTPVFKN